jgi:hypothetical protein
LRPLRQQRAEVAKRIEALLGELAAARGTDGEIPEHRDVEVLLSLAGDLGKAEIGRKMLAREIDPHLETKVFSAHTVAEQLYYAASSASLETVRSTGCQMTPRSFSMLFRPVYYYNAQQKVECIKCFQLILARCGPHLRAAEHGESTLHPAISGRSWYRCRTRHYPSQCVRASTSATRYY